MVGMLGQHLGSIKLVCIFTRVQVLGLFSLLRWEPCGGMREAMDLRSRRTALPQIALCSHSPHAPHTVLREELSQLS